ncbi:MAG: hypothetical protein ABJN52_14435 [Litorimonas sp.]
MNYFINQDLGQDIYSNRADFFAKVHDADFELYGSAAQARVVSIADHYTSIINSSETVLFYLCFDLSIGIVKRKKGYAMDPIWAKGVYEAAKVDFKVYTRLIEVVGENLQLKVAVPFKLRVFAGEVLSGTFPVPSKKGPAETRDKLRNLAVFESADLLCRRFGMQFTSEAKVERQSALPLICKGFAHVTYLNRKIGKPTPSVVDRVWKKMDREQLRYEVSMLKWIENKQKSNRWYKKFGIVFWVTKNY